MRSDVVISILVFFVAVSIMIPYTEYSSNMVILFSVISVVSAILFLMVDENNSNIRRIFLRPSSLFVLAYLIVFFQRPVDYLLGYQDGYLNIGEIVFMLPSLKYAIIGLCMFLIGYLIYARRYNLANRINITYNFKIPSLKFFALLSSILIALVLLIVPRKILLGGYNNDMLTNASIYNYLASWCNTILIAYVVQFTYKAKMTNDLEQCNLVQYIKKYGVWQNLNVIIYILIILNVGDRGPIIALVFSYYISFVIVSKKYISKVGILIALCLGMFLTSILGETKQYRDNNNIFDRISSVIEDNTDDNIRDSFFPLTSQLAGSYCCLPIAIQMVPDNDDFSYGLSTLSDLVVAVPFIGRFFPLPESSSYKISKFALGDYFSYGLGTNCIASLYMDGGVIFIAFGMFVFGILIRKFEVYIFSNTSSSFFIFCLAFYFLSHVISIPRSTLLSPFKYALWMYIIIFVISHFTVSKR